jgi:hypothetical protein
VELWSWKGLAYSLSGFYVERCGDSSVETESHNGNGERVLHADLDAMGFGKIWTGNVGAARS